MPALGVLTILLLIAIGVDDVFLFCDTFEQTKMESPHRDLVHWISETMHHAAMSILVTSLTTSAALFSNLVSDITDIKCFGILSGTAIVMNYFLMITWIPSAVIAIEKLDSYCCSTVKSCDYFEKFSAKVKEISEKIFQIFLQECISKAWFVWIILFLGLGIGGVVVTFITPKLDLPTSQDFALFNKDTTIEVWIQKLKFKYRYYQKENDQKLGGGMYLVGVWGVKGEDRGNFLDPNSIGDLKFDESFDLSQPEAQTWMTEFCHDLINASFAELVGSKCSMDVFNSYLTSSCADMQAKLGGNWNNNLNYCCGKTSVPVDPQTFRYCYYYFTALLGANPNNIPLGLAFYDKNSTAMKAYTIDFRCKQSFTGNYQTMDKFYNKIQDWMNSKLATAPTSVGQGWLTSKYGTFELYDLQSSLASGTYSSIGVSMAAAFIVMLVTSLNVIITVYAIFTIFLTISFCAGILVLLGWELNIIESLTLTMSVGLSIDFVIHYGMGYILSAQVNRKLRVQESFRKVGSSIFMAAATTFIAGACIMPTIVLFYTQLGTFLMIVMTCSWLFSSFFFQSLCYVIGPNGNFSQIPSPCLLFGNDCADGYSGRKISPTHDESNIYNGKEHLFLSYGTYGKENSDIDEENENNETIYRDDPKQNSPKNSSNGSLRDTPWSKEENDGMKNPVFDGNRTSLNEEDRPAPLEYKMFNMTPITPQPTNEQNLGSY